MICDTGTERLRLILLMSFWKKVSSCVLIPVDWLIEKLVERILPSSRLCGKPGEDVTFLLVMSNDGENRNNTKSS